MSDLDSDIGRMTLSALSHFAFRHDKSLGVSRGIKVDSEQLTTYPVRTRMIACTCVYSNCTLDSKFFSYFWSRSNNFNTSSSRIALFWNYLIYSFIIKSSSFPSSGKLFVYCLFEVQSTRAQFLIYKLNLSEFYGIHKCEKIKEQNFSSC